MSNDANKLLPTRQVCERYGVSDRTIARWERDQNLRFPRPVTINNRKYYQEAELTAFDRAQVAQRT
jgi:predicted DNA-binding transcriptional regulator AlpA